MSSKTLDTHTHTLSQSSSGQAVDNSTWYNSMVQFYHHPQPLASRSVARSQV